MIHGPEPVRIQRRGDPEAPRGTAAAVRAGTLPPPKTFQLRGGCTSGPHELHFVEYPLRVLVQERELDRPDRARRGVAAHQGSAKEHVLRANEHGRTFRRVQPPARLDSAHQQVHLVGPGESPLRIHSGLLEAFQPTANGTGSLFRQHPHRETPDQAARRPVGPAKPVRRPAESDACGLAGAGWGDQDLRPAFLGEFALPSVGRATRAESEVVKAGGRNWALIRSAHQSNIITRYRAVNPAKACLTGSHASRRTVLAAPIRALGSDQSPLPCPVGNWRAAVE